MQIIRYHSIYTYVQIYNIKCKILIDKPPASPWHGIRITLTGWHSFCFQNIYECTSNRAKTILNSLQSGCRLHVRSHVNVDVSVIYCASKTICMWDIPISLCCAREATKKSTKNHKHLHRFVRRYMQMLVCACMCNVECSR